MSSMDDSVTGLALRGRIMLRRGGPTGECLGVIAYDNGQWLARRSPEDREARDMFDAVRKLRDTTDASALDMAYWDVIIHGTWGDRRVCSITSAGRCVRLQWLVPIDHECVVEGDVEDIVTRAQSVLCGVTARFAAAPTVQSYVHTVLDSPNLTFPVSSALQLAFLALHVLETSPLIFRWGIESSHVWGTFYDKGVVNEDTLRLKIDVQRSGTSAHWRSYTDGKEVSFFSKPICDISPIHDRRTASRIGARRTPAKTRRRRSP